MTEDVLKLSAFASRDIEVSLEETREKDAVQLSGFKYHSRLRSIERAKIIRLVRASRLPLQVTLCNVQ